MPFRRRSSSLFNRPAAISELVALHHAVSVDRARGQSVVGLVGGGQVLVEGTFAEACGTNTGGDDGSDIVHTQVSTIRPGVCPLSG